MFADEPLNHGNEVLVPRWVDRSQPPALRRPVAARRYDHIHHAL